MRGPPKPMIHALQGITFTLNKTFDYCLNLQVPFPALRDTPMTQPKFDHESEKLAGLVRCAAPLTGAALVELLAWAQKLLKAWYLVATLFAVLAACVSIATPVRSHALVLFVSGWQPRSTPPHMTRAPHRTHRASETALLTSGRTITKRWNQRRDRDDIDSEATAATPLSLELVPPPSLLEQPPSAGPLIAAAHLRVSTGFPRGPPAFS